MSAVLAPRLRIKPLTADELDAVVAIERVIYDFPWTPGNFRDSMRANYSCWGFWQDAELIGYGVMMLGVEEAHLLNISIALSHQNLGHGAQLLEHFIDLARNQGARLLFLEVRPSNEAARHLYARRGFKQIGLRREYYPARKGREDALVLSLPL